MSTYLETFEVTDEISELFFKCSFPKLNIFLIQMCQISEIGVTNICKSKLENIKELYICKKNI